MRATWRGSGTEHFSSEPYWLSVLINLHKQQPADSAAFADNVVAPQIICSKPQQLVSMPQRSLKVNSLPRQGVNCCISLGSKLMP